MSSKDQSRESQFQMAARVANATSSDGYWEAYRKGMMALNLNEMHYRHMAQMASAQKAMADGPKLMPMPFAAKAAYLNRTAKTAKERRVADLMVFVAKYREHKPGIVIFPAWLSEDGRKRLLDIANRH